MRRPLPLLFGLLLCFPCWALAAGSELGNEHLAPYQQRFQRQRPLVAVVGDNRMTELVDYVVPYGVLKQADIADVLALSMDSGPMQMMPALRVQAEQSVAEFDRRYPQGADYLIVPAVHHSDDPRLGGWVAQQAGKGATVIGVCDGALVLGYAGLLKGKRATGHWYSQAQREEAFPDTQWRRDTRYLSDGRVVTTAGVTAALPLSLALVEAIAGPERAAQVAAQLGVTQWSAQHDSSPFALHSADYATAAFNWLRAWDHERLGIEVKPGMDEVALALRADAWSRTFRSEVAAISDGNRTVVMRHGLVVLAEPRAAADAVLAPSSASATAQLDQSLQGIAERYGAATARLVTQQLEYPARGLPGELNQ